MSESEHQYLSADESTMKRMYKCLVPTYHNIYMHQQTGCFDSPGASSTKNGFERHHYSGVHPHSPWHETKMTCFHLRNPNRAKMAVHKGDHERKDPWVEARLHSGINCTTHKGALTRASQRRRGNVATASRTTI